MCIIYTGLEGGGIELPFKIIEYNRHIFIEDIKIYSPYDLYKIVYVSSDLIPSTMSFKGQSCIIQLP